MRSRKDFILGVLWIESVSDKALSKGLAGLKSHHLLGLRQISLYTVGRSVDSIS